MWPVIKSVSVYSCLHFGFGDQGTTLAVTPACWGLEWSWLTVELGVKLSRSRICSDRNLLFSFSLRFMNCKWQRQEPVSYYGSRTFGFSMVKPAWGDVCAVLFPLLYYMCYMYQMGAYKEDASGKGGHLVMCYLGTSELSGKTLAIHHNYILKTIIGY